MKKSELKHIIREEIIKLLKEENETLIVGDASKAILFKVKKILDPMVKQAESLGVIENVKSYIESYNKGHELKYDWKLSFNDRLRTPENKVILNDLFKALKSTQSIYIYPGSFMNDYIAKGGSAAIDFNVEGKSETILVKDKGEVRSAMKTIENKALTAAKNVVTKFNLLAKKIK